MPGQPKAPFYIALFLVVGGLITFAVMKMDVLAPKGGPQGGQGVAGKASEPISIPSEAPDSNSVTTVKEYSFRPTERLPEIKGTAAYKPMVDNTVRFALNVWAGWGPIILANDGFKGAKVWKTPDGKEFKIELVLIDNPITMQDAYSTGDIHIGWATLDMVPLFLERIVDATGRPRDSRVMPRIYQQVDWSNGGDGIIVRKSLVKTVSDLRGKKLVLAQNSPSHYFALNMLVAGGVQPAEVNMVFTEDAFQAAAAFNSKSDLAAAVSWAPDIYNLSKVSGNELLVTTATANKLIADVWFARADFAKDHPGIIESLVRGIFEGMEQLKDPAKKQRCADLMAQGYQIPATDTINMFADAHNTNWAENYQFFMNANNPANFERVWRQSYYLYRRVNSIKHSPVSFDQVMDFTFIEKLGKEPKYSSQKDEYQIAFTPKTVGEIRGESDEILTNTVVIQFFPNSWDLSKKVLKQVNGKAVEELYDPNVENVLVGIGDLVGKFGMARIVIVGHTDASMRGQVSADLVKQLSAQRASAVKEALVRKYPKLDPNQFSTEGKGWDVPVDKEDPLNHVRNRRVEVKVYSAEKQ